MTFFMVGDSLDCNALFSFYSGIIIYISALANFRVSNMFFYFMLII